MNRRGPQLEAPRFREIMGHYPTGVTVVTARVAGHRPVGLTANSVTSVSLEPPLTLVCLSRESSSLGAIHESGAFAVNILGAGDAELAARFAGPDRARRFEGVSWTSRGDGLPILDTAVAWLTCELFRSFEAGDHEIVVGRVTDGGLLAGPPLLYYRGSYRWLDP